jgi:hypothetical protein
MDGWMDTRLHDTRSPLQNPQKKHPKPQAHDEVNACAIGDTVRIDACRPLSKRKAWTVGRILSRERSLGGGGVEGGGIAASAAAVAAPTAVGRGFAASAVGGARGW